MKNNILGATLLFVACCLWGGMFVASKYVLNFMSSMELIWIKYIISFVVLFVFLIITKKKSNEPILFDSKDWRIFCLIGFTGYFLSGLFNFAGTRLSNAHTGALITSTTPVFVFIFARWILKEKITKRKLAALFLASIGVLIVIGVDIQGGDYFSGILLLVGSSIFWALMSVYVKKASLKYDALMITTYGMLFAIIFTTPFMISGTHIMESFLTNKLVVAGILYASLLATALAFLFWNKGMELMDVGTGSLFLFLQPVVASTAGYFLLDEKLNINFFVGGVLIMLGVIVVTYKGNYKKRKRLKMSKAA